MDIEKIMNKLRQIGDDRSASAMLAIEYIRNEKTKVEQDRDQYEKLCKSQEFELGMRYKRMVDLEQREIALIRDIESLRAQLNERKSMRDAGFDPITDELLDIKVFQQRILDLGAQLKAAEQQRDTLAKAIAEAAQKSGGYNGEVELSGPQLLQLLDEMADQLNAAQERSSIRCANDTKEFKAAMQKTVEQFSSEHATNTAAPIPEQQSQANKLADTIKEQQEIAWIQICRLLDELSPDWMARGKKGIDCALDAIRDLSKQQSPALAPEPSELDVYRWFQESTIAHHIEEDGGHISKRAMFLAKKAIAFAQQSPSITEQDAREIISSLVEFQMAPSCGVFYVEEMADKWLASGGRALLDKLNNR